MSSRVVILGAGFGGLELSTMLSEAFGGELVTTTAGYAIGDVATAGVPKAGVFAEGAARVVARELIAELRDGEPSGPYDGRGSYIEFGGGRVGRVDIDFLSGPTKTGTFNAPSRALAAEKEHFGSSRRERWFGD
jgi:sulfide:quinone oxidoreductase